MKKEKLLKAILVVIMGVLLLTMSTNVFAAVDDDLGININPSNTNTNNVVDLTDSVNPPANTNTDDNTANTNTNENTVNTNTNNYNTDLPEAGIAENTVMGIAITVLAIVAIYAYKKVNYYKNI